MEEDSPYRASQAPAPGPATVPGKSWVIEIPSDITRPIKHLWILLCIQTAFALAWGAFQLYKDPSSGVMFVLMFGVTAAINGAFALGVYHRFQLAGTVLAVINVLGLLMQLFGMVKGNVNLWSLGAAVVVTFFSIRGAFAIRDYHAFVANARRRPPGPRLSDDPAFTAKQDA